MKVEVFCHRFKSEGFLEIVSAIKLDFFHVGHRAVDLLKLDNLYQQIFYKVFQLFVGVQTRLLEKV